MRFDPIFLLCFLLLPLLAASVPLRKSSRQYLPPIPGYVPVYIQDGDIPPDVSSLVRQAASARNDVISARNDVHQADAISSDSISADAISSDADADSPLNESGQEIVQQLTQGPAARLFLNVHPQHSTIKN